MNVPTLSSLNKKAHLRNIRLSRRCASFFGTSAAVNTARPHAYPGIACSVCTVDRAFLKECNAVQRDFHYDTIFRQGCQGDLRYNILQPHALLNQDETDNTFDDIPNLHQNENPDNRNTGKVA